MCVVLEFCTDGQEISMCLQIWSSYLDLKLNPVMMHFGYVPIIAQWLYN